MSDIILENRTSYDIVLNIPTITESTRVRKVRMADPDNPGQFVVVEEDIVELKTSFESAVLAATTPQGLGWVKLPKENYDAMVKEQPIFKLSVLPTAEGGLGKISVRHTAERQTA